MTAPQIKLYSLSTCSHCRSVKRFLEDQGVDYEAVDVDLLDSAQRKDVVEQVRHYNGRVSFPTTVIGDRVVVGNKKKEMRDALVEREDASGGASRLRRMS